MLHGKCVYTIPCKCHAQATACWHACKRNAMRCEQREREVHQSRAESLPNCPPAGGLSWSARLTLPHAPHRGTDDACINSNRTRGATTSEREALPIECVQDAPLFHSHAHVDEHRIQFYRPCSCGSNRGGVRRPRALLLRYELERAPRTGRGVAR